MIVFTLNMGAFRDLLKDKICKTEAAQWSYGQVFYSSPTWKLGDPDLDAMCADIASLITETP